MEKNHSGLKAASKKQADSANVVIDFGTRAISDQNFSKMVALPKQALANLGNNIQRVNVELVQEEEEKYLKLTVASQKHGNASAVAETPS